MATHSSILAWEILWTEKHGGLYSMGPKESDMTEQLSIQHIIYRKLKGYSKKSKLTEKFNQNLNTENPYCYFILPSMYRYVYDIYTYLQMHNVCIYTLTHITHTNTHKKRMKLVTN